ncbi:unnamed protein product [Cylindrotheca closterium]|uniref:Uncharacterized protein n=1 Tax=Cylindrotheca closterium TaxID=2856 RepID=A0AAD2CKW3_9STRA|nr:unnamed protein product [Cylindrotheca closterium]
MVFSFWTLLAGGGVPSFDQEDLRLGHFVHLRSKKQKLTWIKTLNRTLIVDILSIGSQSRKELQRTQINTFGTHKTVRNFFVADEFVDKDPKCNQALDVEDTFKISNFCVQKEWKEENQWLMRLMTRHYITRERLEENSNPVGWMCAQARPLFSLFEIQKRYKREPLPDYLIVIDDDSYFNMNKFQKHFTLEGSSRPRAIAGCRIKYHLTFSGPYGGFGLILSRAMLKDLMEPIDCSTNYTTDSICGRIEMDRIGEYGVFRDMISGSLVELMKRYAELSAFRDHKKWTTGYCLHSDWATGYLISLYGRALGTYNSHPRMRSVFNMRFNFDKSPSNICRFEREKCTPKAEACHYVQRGIMSSIFHEQMNQTPNEFGQSPIVIRLRDGD